MRHLLERLVELVLPGAQLRTREHLLSQVVVAPGDEKRGRTSTDWLCASFWPCCSCARTRCSSASSSEARAAASLSERCRRSRSALVLASDCSRSLSCTRGSRNGVCECSLHYSIQYTVYSILVHAYPALQLAHALLALLELLLQRARRLGLLRALGTQLVLHLLRRVVRARQLCSTRR